MQTTTLDNLPARVMKAKHQPELAAWLQAGGRFLLHGWAVRNGSWHVKVIEVTGSEMEAVIIQAPPRQRRRSRWQPQDLFQTKEN